MHDLPRVVSTPDTLHGAYRIDGTRVPVSVLVGSVADGMDEAEVQAAYPSLPQGSVRVALVFAARLLDVADQWVPREVAQVGPEPQPAAGGGVPSRR